MFTLGILRYFQPLGDGTCIANGITKTRKSFYIRNKRSPRDSDDDTIFLQDVASPSFPGVMRNFVSVEQIKIGENVAETLEGRKRS